jgi:hypothetical protein
VISDFGELYQNLLILIYGAKLQSCYDYDTFLYWNKLEPTLQIFCNEKTRNMMHENNSVLHLTQEKCALGKHII